MPDVLIRMSGFLDTFSGLAVSCSSAGRYCDGIVQPGFGSHAFSLSFQLDSRYAEGLAHFGAERADTE